MKRAARGDGGRSVGAGGARPGLARGGLRRTKTERPRGFQPILRACAGGTPHLRKNPARFSRVDRELRRHRARSNSALNIAAQSGVLPGRITVTLMNRTAFTLVVAAGLSAGIARAQTPASAPVAQPSSPAPVVVQAPAAPAAAATSTAPGVTQIVYSPKLPTAEELTHAAAAQGYTVEKIVQTANQVIAFYRNASGQPTTVAYQSLPPTGTPAPAPAATVVTPTATPAVVVTSPPPATVVYETAPRVIYHDYPRYYYPRVWYPSVSFGFGYRSYHGGFHGHHPHHRGFRHR